MIKIRYMENHIRLAKSAYSVEYYNKTVFKNNSIKKTSISALMPW